MNAEAALTAIGTNVASISVIIVYHLFAIQSWTERVESLRDEAVRLSLRSLPGDVTRRDAEQRARRLRHDFPWGQILLIGVAFLALALVSGYVAGTSIGVPVLVTTALPMGVLLAVYAASTAIAYERGKRVLADAHRYLSDEDGPDQAGDGPVVERR